MCLLTYRSWFPSALPKSGGFSFVSSTHHLALFPITSPGHSGDARIKLSHGFAITNAEAFSPAIYNCRIKQEGITLPEGKKLRLGHSKTPLRDALVKEFKASLLGKAPIFPEEEMEQRKKEYLTFLLGESVH